VSLVDQLRARAILELRRRRKQPQQQAARGWRSWLARYFPRATSAGFSPRHVRLWDWLDSLRPHAEPTDPVRVEIWPRGGAKSTTAELGVAYVGTQFRRRFALYVCGTQAQANKHVQAIRVAFETLGISRAIDRYGYSLGWRMDLLRVAGGFNVLAFGLDSAARGVKLDDFRPDFIIFDDVDNRLDSLKAVEKKITTITETILPMGASDLVVLVIQNRVHPHSVVSRLADGRADFLNRRQVFEEPAVAGLKIEGKFQPDGTRRYRIVAGEATWPGQNLETCEKQINDWGRVAFMREAQHDLSEAEGGMWSRARDIDPFRTPAKADEYDLIVVGIDPNTTEGNDDAGIIVAGSRRVLAGVDRLKGGRPVYKLHVDILEDVTAAGGPKVWSENAVAAYHRWRADRIVAEGNNGGDMVAITIGTVPLAPRVKIIHASRGKATRAKPVQKVCEEGLVHHVGVFVELERELCTWKEGEPSPNRLDAYVWVVTELLDLKLEPGTMAPWFPGQGSSPSMAAAKSRAIVRPLKA
jgi:terminase large subunit-like protein